MGTCLVCQSNRLFFFISIVIVSIVGSNGAVGISKALVSNKIFPVNWANKYASIRVELVVLDLVSKYLFEIDIHRENDIDLFTKVN